MKTHKKKAEPEPGKSIILLTGSGLGVGILLGMAVGNVAVGIAMGISLCFLGGIIYKRTSAL